MIVDITKEMILNALGLKKNKDGDWIVTKDRFFRDSFIEAETLLASNLSLYVDGVEISKSDVVGLSRDGYYVVAKHSDGRSVISDDGIVNILIKGDVVLKESQIDTTP